MRTAEALPFLFIGAFLLPACKPSTPVDSSLDALERRMEGKEEKMVAALSKEHLQALEHYLTAFPAAADREQALKKIITLGQKGNDHAAVIRASRLFIAEFPTSDACQAVWGALLIAACADVKTLPLAVSLERQFEQLPEAPPEQIGANKILLARALVDSGRVEAARKKLQEVPDVPGLEEFSRVSEFVNDELAKIEPIGKPFEDFAVRDLQGQPLSAARFRGKVVLIDFWATWCSPCRKQVPELVALHRKFQSQGLQIIGINVDDDETFAAVPRFLEETKIVWPQFSDRKGLDGPLPAKYGVDAIPETILLDRSGNFYRRGLRGDDLEKAVERLITQPASGPAGRP